MAPSSGGGDPKSQLERSQVALFASLWKPRCGRMVSLSGFAAVMGAALHPGSGSTQVSPAELIASTWDAEGDSPRGLPGGGARVQNEPASGGRGPGLRGGLGGTRAELRPPGAGLGPRGGRGRWEPGRRPVAEPGFPSLLGGRCTVGSRPGFSGALSTAREAGRGWQGRVWRPPKSGPSCAHPRLSLCEPPGVVLLGCSRVTPSSILRAPEGKAENTVGSEGVLDGSQASPVA